MPRVSHHVARFVVAAILAGFTVPAAALDDPRLIPKPRELTAGDRIALTGAIVIDPAANDDDRFAARDLADVLKERGFKIGTGAGYRISLLRAGSAAAKRLLDARPLVFTEEMKSEGYVVIAERNGTTVIGSGAQGVFYGAQTVKQLLRIERGNATVNLAVIRDWPAMKYRGFQDDLSRGPVPTTEYRKKQNRTTVT